LHSYINFPMIDDLRQRLLNQYLRIGLEADSQVPGPPDHPFQTFREGSSWEGNRHIQLPHASGLNYCQYLQAIPRFRRNRDGLSEKSTQTCQATQTWIFYFWQIIWQRQWAIWRFQTYRTDPTSFVSWSLQQNDCHRHLLWQ
jgi:hypothetical protein